MSWKNCELPREIANKFKDYLYQNKIKFESSECLNLIHFECLMTDAQMDKANVFFDTL